jgi:hypothetical protein
VRHTHEESGYGFFCGGDPRDFCPDGECSTDAEREKHKADCAAWDRGENPNVNANAPHSTESAHVVPSGYGLGMYTVEYECDDPNCPDNEQEAPHPDSYRPDLPLSGGAS